MIYGIDIQTPMRYLIFFILGIILLSIVIRVIVRNILEVFYEQKQKHVNKMTETKQSIKEK